MRQTREPFNINKDTYAKKDFLLSGKKFKMGELFDWKEIGLTLQKTERLYRGLYLYHKRDEEKPQPPKVKKKKEAGAKPLNKYTEKEIIKMSYPKLKKLCADNNLSALGKANELRQRLFKRIK